MVFGRIRTKRARRATPWRLRSPAEDGSERICRNYVSAFALDERALKGAVSNGPVPWDGRGVKVTRRLSATPNRCTRGTVFLSFKGTPGKRLLWISIVVILVILAAAYFLFISPR